MKNKTFNLFKKSMSERWRAYRPQFDWFKVEDIEAGTDENWNELVSLNPSLEKAVFEFSRCFKEKKTAEFVDRYGVDPQTLNDFFHIYVGYHPAFGLYLTSIGPYKGPKAEDADNKFGYFNHRLASTDSYCIKNLIGSYLAKHPTMMRVSAELGLGKNVMQKIKDEEGNWAGEWEKGGLWDIVDPSDFVMNVQHRTGSKKKEGGINWGSEPYEKIDITPEYMAENDIEEAQKNNRPIPYRTVLGIGSMLQMKPSGAIKILKAVAKHSGHNDMVIKSVEMIAQRRGIPPEMIRDTLMTDDGFAKEVCDEYAKINPSISGIFHPKKSGAQQPDALTTPTQMIKTMRLKEEIIKSAIEARTEDPTALADYMNLTRKSKGLAQGKLTPEIINYLLEDFSTYRNVMDNQGNVVGKRSYEEILPQYLEDLGQAESLRGFDDMESALRIASLYAAGAVGEVDPVTKAKLIKVPPIFEVAEGTRNFTSEELTGLRNGSITSEDLEQNQDAEQIGEGITPIVQEDVIEETPIDQTQEKGLEDIDIVKPQVKTPPKEVVLEEEEDEVLARTLKTLIKIAQDLRSRRQGKAAWGIERVIRKYQRKI